MGIWNPLKLQNYTFLRNLQGGCIKNPSQHTATTDLLRGMIAQTRCAIGHSRRGLRRYQVRLILASGIQSDAYFEGLVCLEKMFWRV